MSSVYKDRYGIPGADVTNLVRRFYRSLYDSDWETADAFIKWCSENGWKSGLRLCRRDTSKPQGPENSFFKTPEMTVKGMAADKRRRQVERKNGVCHFCDGCTEECREGVGCERWRQHFIMNWNKNIHVPKVKPVVQEKPMVFRYEHPDLVREGIVFEGSGSM